VDGQSGKLAMVVGHQFITLTVYICEQHGRHDAAHRAGLLAEVETFYPRVASSARVTAMIACLSACLCVTHW